MLRLSYNLEKDLKKSEPNKGQFTYWYILIYPLSDFIHSVGFTNWFESS